MYIVTYACKRFIVRNWLVELWNLPSHQICRVNQKAANLNGVDHLVSRQSERPVNKENKWNVSWQARELDGANTLLRSSPKVANE